MDHDQCINYILLLLKTGRFCLALVQDDLRLQIIQKLKEDYPHSKFIYIDIQDINSAQTRGKNALGWYEFLLNQYLLKSFDRVVRASIERILDDNDNFQRFKQFLLESFEKLLSINKSQEIIIIFDSIKYISDSTSYLSKHEINQFFTAICEAHHQQSRLKFLLLGSPLSNNLIHGKCAEVINVIPDPIEQPLIIQEDKIISTSSDNQPQEKPLPPDSSKPNNPDSNPEIKIDFFGYKKWTSKWNKFWSHRVKHGDTIYETFGGESRSDTSIILVSLFVIIALGGIVSWFIPDEDPPPPPPPPTPSPTISVSPSPEPNKIYQDPDGLFQFKYPSTLKLVSLPQQSWGQNTIIELYFKEDPRNLAWIQIERFNDSTPEDGWTDEDKDSLLASPADPDGSYQTIESSEKRDGCLLYRFESSSGKINHYWCLVLSGQSAYRISYEAPVLEYDRLKSEAQIVFDSFQTNQGNL